MNLIILVVCMVSLILIKRIVADFITSRLPDRPWIQTLCSLPGYALGLTYMYFAGYFVMDPNTSLFWSLAVALGPTLVYVAIKAASRTRLIEE